MDHGTSSARLFKAPLPRPIDAAEQVLRVGTANLWLRRAGGGNGGGDTVIFVHPWTGSGHSWPYQETGFVEAGYQTLCYSRRGYHGSDCGEPGDESDAVDDLAELVGALGLERFHLVGSAAGAMTCAGFACRHRGDRRLGSLTLACSMLGLPDDSIDGLASVTSFPQWKDLPHDIRELGPSYRAVNADGVALWRELHERCRGDNPPHFHQRLGAPSSVDDVAKIAVPTLYLAGSADLYSPPPLLEWFADRTPDARFSVLEGAGHSAYWERPDAFNDLVLGFIDEAARR